MIPFSITLLIVLVCDRLYTVGTGNKIFQKLHCHLDSARFSFENKTWIPFLVR